MVNKLFGDDFATFEIVENIHSKKADKDESKEIEALLTKIESSDIIFVRNGEEHTLKKQLIICAPNGNKAVKKLKQNKLSSIT
jgi:hypothetical protein